MWPNGGATRFLGEDGNNVGGLGGSAGSPGGGPLLVSEQRERAWPHRHGDFERDTFGDYHLLILQQTPRWQDSSRPPIHALRYQLGSQSVRAAEPSAHNPGG